MESAPKAAARAAEASPFARAPLRGGGQLANLGILALLPLALLLFNDYWAFTSAQSVFIDPWRYTGYFLHLKAQLLAFPSSYASDRFSDSLPGWFIYQAFGPWVGNYVFKAVVIYTASFATYFAASRLFHPRVALIAGLLVGAQPYYLIAFGWDYVDGICVAYFSLSLLFAFRAAWSNSWRLSLFLAGFFGACAMSAHFLWLNLGGTVLVAYFGAQRGSSRHSVWKSLCALFMGALTAVILFCLVYHYFTGNWFYLANSLRHTLNNGLGAARKVNAALVPTTSPAIWLAPYTGLIPVACWWIFRRDTQRSERLCLILAVTAYATAWVWQAVGFPFVILWYYSSFLFPLYALGVAAVLNRPVRALSDRAYIVAVAGCVAAGAVLFGGVPIWDWLHDRLRSAPAGPSILREGSLPVFALICLLAALPVCFRPLKHLSLGTFAAGLFLVYGLQLIALPEQGWFSGRESFTNKQAFRLILDADAWIGRFRPDRRLLWWLDGREPKQGLMAGVTGLYLRGYSMLNQELPKLSSKDVELLDGPRRMVLVVSSKPDSVVRAREALSGAGISVRTERTATIANGPLALSLALFDTKPMSLLPGFAVAREGLQEVPGVLSLDQFQPVLASVQRSGSVTISAVAPAWAYLAYAPLRLPAGETWVRVTARVRKGQVGFGILNVKETDFHVRKFLDEDEDSQDVLLPISHPEDSVKLIIQNGSVGGRLSEVIVENIGLFARPKQ